MYVYVRSFLASKSRTPIFSLAVFQLAICAIVFCSRWQSCLFVSKTSWKFWHICYFVAGLIIFSVCFLTLSRVSFSDAFDIRDSLLVKHFYFLWLYPNHIGSYFISKLLSQSSTIGGPHIESEVIVSFWLFSFFLTFSIEQIYGTLETYLRDSFCSFLKTCETCFYGISFFWNVYS